MNLSFNFRAIKLISRLNAEVNEKTDFHASNTHAIKGECNKKHPLK